MGPVYATTLNVTGTGAVNFLSGTTNVTATNFAADGTITLGHNTTVIGALTTTAGANTGTLTLNGGSVLNGAVGGAIGLREINLVGGSQNGGATATITGATDAFTFALATNTLQVGGALTIANSGASGVISTTLASPTVYGNIRPVGATNLGPALQINVTVPNTSFIPVGTQFNIVQTQAGTVQSGTDGSVVKVTVKDPSNPLYTFAAVPAAGTVAGLVAIRTTSIPLLAPLVTPPGVPLPPTRPVAAVIVPVLLTAPSGAIVDVLAPINALTDPSAVVNAVAQLAPSTASLAAPQVTFQVARQFQNLWTSHLDDALCSQIPRRDDKAQPSNTATICTGAEPRSGWWLRGTGSSANQGAQGGLAGYHASIAGGMIGYDHVINANTVVGLGIGASKSAINGKGTSSRTEFNSYQVTAYVGHREGPWYVYGDVSAGLNDYTGSRQISFPGVNRTARAKYSGQDYTGFATTGYDFAAGGMTITPLASLQYTHVNLGGYTEADAGSINLATRSQSYDFLESGLGVKVARTFVRNELAFIPEVHAKWLHELSNPMVRQTSAFAVAPGASFTTRGLKAAADTGNIGAGLTILSCSCSVRTWSLEAVYDYYQGSDKYSAHQGMLKFSARF